MELRVRRSQETGGECANILLRSGDMIDDSMAVFDALKLSGGSRRALMSLSLGNSDFLLCFAWMLIMYVPLLEGISLSYTLVLK